MYCHSESGTGETERMISQYASDNKVNEMVKARYERGTIRSEMASNQAGCKVQVEECNDETKDKTQTSFQDIHLVVGQQLVGKIMLKKELTQ